MNQRTSTRRRWATLTSGALIAGGLVAAPAVAGLSAATAAPVELGYTCTVVGGGQSIPQDSTISIDITVPDSVEPGATVPASLDAVIDMGSAAFGPIQSVTGTFTIPITVGGATTEFTLPSSTAPVSDLTFTGTAAGDLTAPGSAGAAPITVGTVIGNHTTTPFGAATVTTCVPDAGQDQTVGSLNVEGDGPVEPGTPEGILYHCTYDGMPTLYDGYVDLDADLPASIDQGSGYNPDVDATISWTDEAAAGFRSLGLGVQEDSAALNLSTASGQGEGTTDIPLSETDIPAEGDVVWTGSGSYGALETSVPGEQDLTVGDGTITMQANVKFLPAGVYVPATFDCAVAEGEDTTIGTVTVNQTAHPVEVDGKVKVTGTAKVGKKLKAVPGKAAGAKTSYQWLANGKAIKKATKKTLKLDKSLKGKKVAVRVTYSQADHLDVVQTSKAVKVKKNKKK